MKDYVDAVERLFNRRGVANISFDKLRRRIQMFRHASFMNLRNQRIKYPNAMSAFDQSVDEVRTDKARPTGYQDIPFFQCDPL